MADGVRRLFEAKYLEEQEQKRAQREQEEAKEKASTRKLAIATQDAREKVPIIAASLLAADTFAKKGVLIAPFVELEDVHPIKHPIKSMRGAAYNRRALKPFGENHVIIPDVKIRNQNKKDHSGEMCWGEPRTVALGDHTNALQLTKDERGSRGLYLMREGLRIGGAFTRDYASTFHAQKILEVDYFRPGGISQALDEWQFGKNGQYAHREDEDPSLPTIVEFTDSSVENFHNPVDLHGWLSHLATSCAVEINPDVLTLSGTQS